MFRRAGDALDGSEIAALRAASSILIDFVNEWSLRTVLEYSNARARKAWHLRTRRWANFRGCISDGRPAPADTRATHARA